MTAPASSYYRRLLEAELRQMEAARIARRGWLRDLARVVVLIVVALTLIYLAIYAVAADKGAELTAGIVANSVVALAFYVIIARDIENRHEREQRDDQRRTLLSFVLSQYHQLLSQVHAVQRVAFEAGENRAITSTKALSHIASELRHTANVMLDVGRMLKAMGEEIAKEVAYQDMVNSIAKLALTLVRNEPLLGVEVWVREEVEDLVSLHPREFDADPHLRRFAKLLNAVPKRARNYKKANPIAQRVFICDLADGAGHVCALMADSLVERFVTHFKPLRERLASEEEPVPAPTDEQLSFFEELIGEE
jgi:signal transduction histidine kinase